MINSGFLLDYYSGSHGNFLEYLINRFIFKVPKVENIFTKLGTCDILRQMPEYGNARMLQSNHYSEFSYITPDVVKKVVRIVLTSEQERVCYQINVDCRAGDIPSEKKVFDIPDELRKSPSQLRQTYYAKLKFKENGYQLPDTWLNLSNDVYNFPMGDLYNFQKLVIQLNKLSYFLECTFNPGPELVEVWQQFIDRNHGLQAWKKVETILFHVMSNNDWEFVATPWEQALLNLQLTEIINIADGPLFDNDTYPTNSQQVWKHVQESIAEFDNRF